MTGIAISGRAGSGKSTLAAEVVRQLAQRGVKAERASFADALKREVFTMWGIRKTDVGGREALIRYGQGKREENPFYWIDKLAIRLDVLSDFGIVPVIDDMRFVNEYAWLRGRGFLTVRVVSPRILRVRRLEEQGLDGAFAESQEPSEVDLIGVPHDLEFRNRRDPLRLAQLAEGLAAHWPRGWTGELAQQA